MGKCHPQLSYVTLSYLRSYAAEIVLHLPRGSEPVTRQGLQPTCYPSQSTAMHTIPARSAADGMGRIGAVPSSSRRLRPEGLGSVCENIFAYRTDRASDVNPEEIDAGHLA